MQALRRRAAGLSACVLAGCTVSLLLGQDRNWDLLNYHLYTAFALLHGRLGVDLYAVGKQSYFNPLLDVPYYLLAVDLLPDRPRAVTFLAGIPAGVLAYLTWRIGERVCAGLPGARRWDGLLATGFGLSGTMLWSEIGTTTGDLPIAILILAGLGCALREPGWRGALLAGLFLGGAAGLKLTAVLFAPAMALALLVQPQRARWPRAAVFAGGWWLAFAAAFGWWGHLVAQHFGNPVYPLLNGIFASPWAPPTAGSDPRFFPRSTMQALFYPFYWLQGRPFVAAELPVRDAHFAIAMLAAGVLAAAAIVRKWSRRGDAGPTPGPDAVLLVVFVVAAFVVWEAAFSILRYIVALEALTGLTAWLGLRCLLAHVPGPPPRRVFAALLAAAALFANRPGWGRLRHTAASTVQVDAPALPDRSQVLLAGRPVGFVAPFLHGRDIAFIGLPDKPDTTLLGQTIRARIADPRPLFAVIDTPNTEAVARLALQGLTPAWQTCQPLPANLRAGLFVCETKRN